MSPSWLTVKQAADALQTDQAEVVNYIGRGLFGTDNVKHEGGCYLVSGGIVSFVRDLRIMLGTLGKTP